MQNLETKFDHLYRIIQSGYFLNPQTLGGEVPFFITTYSPVQQVLVDRHIAALVNKLHVTGLTVLEINLYSLSLELLEKRGILQKIIEKEPVTDKGRFLKILQAPLDVTDNLAPAIAEKIRDLSCQVIFLTGIGLVFPYIRSHTILNNLQSVIKKTPVVIFFPGVYDGNSLNLFGKLKDDNYYRAFLLDNLKV